MFSLAPRRTGRFSASPLQKDPRSGPEKVGPLVLPQSARVAPAPERPKIVEAAPTPAPAPAPAPPPPKGPAQPPVGQRLLAMGAVSPGDLIQALGETASLGLPLGQVLLTRQAVGGQALASALAAQWGTAAVDLDEMPPDTRLVDQWGAQSCLAMGLIPWRRIGAATVIATTRPERFHEVRGALERRFGPVVMVVTDDAGLTRKITNVRARHLAQLAETRVSARLSCRSRPGIWLRTAGLGLLTAAIGLLLWAPKALAVVLLLWATLTMVALSTIKAVGVVLSFRPAARGFRSNRSPTRDQRLPVVSVLVPLFREENVAGHLLKRIHRLAYPRALTDILLICEEDDATTVQALHRTDLPPWMRVVYVPRGELQTKPRALNYALDFCRGDIVGVWDAEDAPAPDQLHRVVQRFAAAPKEVACLQGVLDYYNSRRNWLSRCFTLEYAAWFRVMLPALSALRLPVPLGGTTLFFRRSVLEALGGWDAHNVTEDADLGLRLCRAGYRTELLNTVTEEEANCRSLAAWVKQRSRWLKGYAMTWAVHMRAPRELWRDLGPWGFFGVQVLFLGTLSQFLLAPALWMFWPLALGLAGPWDLGLPTPVLITLVSLAVLAGAISIATSFAGAVAAGKTRLAPWILSLPLYFPLAVLACYGGLWEAIWRPFHWQKTTHGAPETPDQ